LVNLFKRDKHIDFEQLLFEPKEDSQASGPSLPRDLAGWRKYRVVILGDLAPDQLTVAQQELLKTFVAEESGNLIVIGGETAMPAGFVGQPLEGMLPTLATGAPLNREQGCSLAGWRTIRWPASGFGVRWAARFPFTYRPGHAPSRPAMCSLPRPIPGEAR
jgi:hypothetical protein